MGKCPLYGKCTIDASLLASVGAEDKASERYKYDHVLCQGKGTPPNQWEGCIKYSPNSIMQETPFEIAKKEDRNMKIGILIGAFFGVLWWIKIYNLDVDGDNPFLYFIFFTIYGIGFSSISITINAIQKFIENLIGDFGCIIPVLLYVFVAPYISCLLPITLIVGIVRYFKRRPMLKYTNE